jgi:hypothetical protein
MAVKWERVQDPADLGPRDDLRVQGYDDAEVRRMSEAEVVRLVALGAVMRRITDDSR